MTVTLAWQSLVFSGRRGTTVVATSATTAFKQSPRARVLSRASNISRLLSTLAILEQRNGKLQKSSLSAITAAKKLGGPVSAFVAGSGVKGSNGAANEIAAGVDGLEKVIAVENGAYDRGLPESFAPLLVENIRKEECTHVVASHSMFMKNILPRVAAFMDNQPISDIISVESPDTFVRPIYAGNAILTVQSDEPVKLLTVRSTSFAPAPLEASSASTTIADGVDPSLPSSTEWVSEDLTTTGRPDLGSAKRVVSGGRALKSKEDFEKYLVPLADTLNAAIGASRAAVDSGFADNSLQVGQTGKNVAPELYIAVGISGAIQHLAGMKDSKVIAAINKDAEAPIFSLADVGLVGDASQILPELTEKLEAMKQ